MMMYVRRRGQGFTMGSTPGCPLAASVCTSEGEVPVVATLEASDLADAFLEVFNINVVDVIRILELSDKSVKTGANIAVMLVDKTLCI